MKKVMPSLQIQVFISFSFVCLIFQAQRQLFSFSLLYFVIHFIGTAVVKNKCYVFLASKQSSFCFIGNALSVSDNRHHQRCI